MIQRETFLHQLVQFKDKRIIKIVTGIRRCGKSTLLLQFIDYLRSKGIPENRIIYINLESARYDSITDYHGLYKTVSTCITSEEMHYILIDEVQNVLQFEKAVNSLSIDYNVDIYLTGSNAYLLSSEIATLLSGRYVEIHLMPLSFAEYLTVQNGKSAEEAFYKYLKYGSFPFIAGEDDEMIITNYLDGIYNTVVFRDVIKKNNVKDATLMENILKTVFSSIGSIVSPSSIAKTLKNEGKKVTNETVEKYLDMFCNAFILNKAVRYDVKGKSYLKTLNKYYVTDMGLRNYVLGYREINAAQALENDVYFELLRRGYIVDIGKAGDTEIDFVARTAHTIEYYQVSFTVNNAPETLERELRPFNAVPGHSPCFLITMDKDFVSDINGVKKLYAVDWFLGTTVRK